MPRLADHDERRGSITDAARRVIARGGLDAATFQSVAAEAGVSVRSVQYYFGTKREFLLATHRAVVADSGARLAAGLAGLAPGSGPREVVRAILLGLLPLDEPSRQNAVILGIFHAAALTGPDIESADTAGAPNYIVDAVATQLRAARGTEADDAAIRADAEVILLALGGLTQGMLTSDHYAAHAPHLVEHLLDRVFDA
ncbi:TetR/AcrR family transcriptional regulator [Nocardia caishijiensis]|uniref:TetR family transcriptional regulator n=1 Tax=Nocardia caishijiensis TaxID=184756 RepID=A0ABQ6YE95_9NOCA|nr:TetR/AcrR family transcriptional regulator [Nocardia caishijiensis]KAF0835739.1 TetR family transcriptional regulator [Nocardia caishijiensis]